MFERNARAHFTGVRAQSLYYIYTNTYFTARSQLCYYAVCTWCWFMLGMRVYVCTKTTRRVAVYVYTIYKSAIIYEHIHITCHTLPSRVSARP